MLHSVDEPETRPKATIRKTMFLLGLAVPVTACNWHIRMPFMIETLDLCHDILLYSHAHVS